MSTSQWGALIFGLLTIALLGCVCRYEAEQREIKAERRERRAQRQELLNKTLAELDGLIDLADPLAMLDAEMNDWMEAVDRPLRKTDEESD